MSEIVIYENGVVSLEAMVEKDTLWLSQQQIAELLAVQRPAITKHISNIFKSEELSEEVVCFILEHTTKHGAMPSRTQEKKTLILFLQKNQMLYRTNGEAKVNDNALVALTLMPTKSLPEQKDTVVALIVNMLMEEQ